ncbi:ATP-binding protein [Opitutales bacterium]|jgi:two-component system phosphate regulon sensor histidine kinase PhoR|nr:ATP-binding protein [Opitutales bacterium]
MWGFGIALGFLFFVYLFVRHKSTQKQIEEDLLKTNNSNQVNTDNAEFISRMVDGALLIDKNHKIICSNNEANQFFGTEKSINGRRLEAIIHSVDVLEFIHPLILHGEKGKAEFSFEAKKNTYKEFEVAGSVFSDDGNEKEMTYLLLFRDITEMKNMEKMRRDFVSNASHELRTPVTLIKGFSESLMESGNEMPEGQRGSFLKKIFNNSMRLQTLVDDLLSISELETNKGSLNLSNNRLCDIISGVEGYIFDKSYVDSSKIVFSLVEEKDSFPMDAVKMSMAIGNLIDNAFKYAGNTDKIEVSTRINDDLSMIICDVKDTGIGIPSDDLPRIFERFYVVNKGRSRDKGGTGLGLSIVKHIIESHSGTVSVKSKIGKGTTFTFTLPLKP